MDEAAPRVSAAATSDVPSGLPKEPNPARDKWMQKIKAEIAQDEEFNKQVKTIEKELGSVNWTYIDMITEDEPFNVSEFTRAIICRPEYNIVTDKNSQVIYLYTEKTGIYHKDGENYLKFIIDSVLGPQSSSHRINETIDLIKVRTCATFTYSPEIAVQNGLLDIQTGKLAPFTPFEFNTNKLNVEYKEGAKSESWLEFINQVCPADKDLLQEWSGYLLIKGYPYHAIMWLYGPTGRNGKGVWARTMQAILGEANYSSVSIDEFDGKHRFAVFGLHDSLFNICSEPRTDRMLTIELLQALTGQDSIDAERKGVQERFKFKNSAKMTVMGNKFPKVDNPTNAFWERLKLIKFPFQFVGADQIPNIEKNWLDDPEQRSGILNWMIEGALRLINNLGRFTETKTQQETIIQFKRASDSIGAFLAECIEFDSQAYARKNETQELYKGYCELIGVVNESDKKVAERLKNTPRVKDTSIRIGGQKTKIWKGIKLKPLPKIEGDDEETTEGTQQTTLGGESGTSGTSGTDYEVESPSKFEISLEKEQDPTQKSVPTVPSVPNTQNRVCGDCGRFHLPSCGFPSGAFEKVPADWWANEFKCWIPRQAEMPNFEDKEAP